MKVPSSDTGTEIAGMMVARPLRRKANTTITTSAIEIASACSNLAQRRAMVVVRSITTSMSMASGIVARSRQQVLHAVDGLQNVGARLPVDDELHRGFAVSQAHVASSCTLSVTVGDIGEAQRAPFFQLTTSGKYSAAFLA